MRWGRGSLVGLRRVRAYQILHLNLSIVLMHLFSQEKITRMEGELLNLNLKDPKLIAVVSGNIGQAVSGSSSHLADALKFGLEKGIEFQRRRRGALLQCPDCGYTRHTNPVSPSFVGPNVLCPDCLEYMQFASCGHQRTGDYTSCQSCRSRRLL